MRPRYAIGTRVVLASMWRSFSAAVGSRSAVEFRIFSWKNHEWSRWARASEISTSSINYWRALIATRGVILYIVWLSVESFHTHTKSRPSSSEAHQSFFLENLGVSTCDYYSYLNQSGCYRAEGTDDAAEYAETLVFSCMIFGKYKKRFFTLQQAMQVVGISEFDQMQILKVRMRFTRAIIMLCPAIISLSLSWSQPFCILGISDSSNVRTTLQ